MIASTRLLLTAGALALVAAGGVAAQTATTDATQAPQRVRPDANGDGNLTRAEAMAAAEARFARMDANRDGRLTAADREAARDNRRDAAFDRMDADNNGSVTRAEYDAAGEAMDARRAERREARADRRGGDRAAQGHRGGRHHGARAFHRGARMEMARAADTNIDQAIDRAEFMAAAEARFTRGDTDGNGTISAAERQAARAAMRAARRAAPAAAPANQ